MPIFRAIIIAFIYAFYIDNNKSKYYVKFNKTLKPEEIWL